MTKSVEKLRFGICGLGFMGRTYFRHLRHHPRACVTAVCDCDAARRAGNWQDALGNIQATAGERVDLTSIRAYATVAELFGDETVDVVAITLPTCLHADLSVAGLRAGKHVLCEKPMALTVADCDRMIDAAQESRRTLMIAQCIRFWPQYELIKQMADGGQLGEVRFASLRRLASPPGYSADNWLLDGRRSGGALFDLHVHDVDFTHYLLGPPARVYACGSRGVSGGIDHIVATYEYADGRYGLLEGGWSWHAPWPFEMAITVHGAKGTLTWSNVRGPDVLHYAGGSQPQALHVADETGWARELDYYVDCVRCGEPVARCLPGSSRASIALVLLENRAMERGKPQGVASDVRGAARG